MDPPTHGLLGATIAQAGFGRPLGWRGVLAGAGIAMAPDLDVIMTASGPMGEWLYHRGWTHALWLAPLLCPAIGWVAARSPEASAPRVRAWTLLFLLTMLSHPLLDWCTTYGTQLLAPFSDRRFALDAIAIVDPVYTVLLLAALAVGARRRFAGRAAVLTAAMALVSTTAYLGYGFLLNRQAEVRARAQLTAEGWHPTDVRSYPTLLQLYLRRIVARRDDKVRVGWLSLWRPHRVAWESFAEASGPLVEAARRTEEGRVFEWFAMGQTTAAIHALDRGSVVEINDLRFGLPGRPDEGLWGIRVRFDEAGRVAGRPERIARPLPRPLGTLVADIFRRTFAPGP
jgi:inner membrane protein